MNLRKFLYPILIVPVILLTTGVGPARAWSSTHQVGALEQGLAAAASGGAPIGSSFLIADQSVDTENPVVVYNSQQQEYLVVWWNDRPGNDDIYGQRVSKTGTLIGPWFAIAYGVGYDRQNPSVAYNSQQNEYLVVWQQYVTNNSTSVGIYGQRLSAAGLPLGGVKDIAVSTISFKYFESAVAYDSAYDKYLAIYISYDGATSTHAVVAQALNNDGSVWGSSFEIEPNLAGVGWPDLAYNFLLNEFLVTWDQGSGQDDVMARRVRMTGGAGVLGSIFTISSDTTNSDWTPRVAAVSRSSDGQYLVVWEHCKNNPMCSQADTRAQLISGTGNLEGGTIQFPTPLTDAIEADVAGCENSSAYFVTWMQSNNVSGGDIAGRFVSVGGAMQPDFWLSGDSAQVPTVACGPHGDYLVVYMNKTATSNEDIWGRLVGNRVYLPLVVK